MTRGLRNNNPGNIIVSSIPWQGKKTNNTDGHFEQFIALRYGCRALLINLETAIKQHALNTLDKLIHSYAPSNENNTMAYITTVSNLTGVPADMPLNGDDASQVTAIAYAICVQENGLSETEAAGITQAYLQEQWNAFKL